MQSVVGHRADGGTVTVAWTERSDGDLSIGSADVERRRRAVVDRPWIWCRQVHGARVVVVGEGDPGSFTGDEADALVTRRDDVAIAVQSADCVTVGLWSDDGVLGAVHCGWRGLERGVVDAAVGSMRSFTSGRLHAVVGPSIGPECYEFDAPELERVRAVAGEVVVGRTAAGRPALDVRAGVRAGLDRLGVAIEMVDERCTACEGSSLHSHRARGESGRQALVVWSGR